MSTNTNGIQRTNSASGSKRKADEDAHPTTTKKKTTKRKQGLIFTQGPSIVRSSSALGHSTTSTSRPASALAPQHPRTSPTPPTSDGESSRRPLTRKVPPASPPLPAIAAARARGDGLPPVNPTPSRAPSRTGSVARAAPSSQAVAKGKGKARVPGLGLPESRQGRSRLEEDAEALENERWMAGQRSELDARERDNQRRAGKSNQTSTIKFASSAPDSTPVQRKPKPRLPDQSASTSSALSGVTQDSTQPVPISDTPVIVRNREIRQASQSRRRSSLSSRGKRASQSLSSGLLASPHPSVPSDTFFRHVDPELPDALRLRQILAWTTSRASAQPPRPSLPPLSPELGDILKAAQAASSRKIVSGQINTSISPPQRREDQPLAPNPRNTVNAQAISRLEAYNQACQVEDTAWSELIAAYNAQQATVVAALASASARAEGEVELDETWREQVELTRGILKGYEMGVDGLDEDEKELVELMTSLESKVDEAHDSTYRAAQFLDQASVYVDHVFSSLAQKLRQKTAARTALAPRDESGRMLGVQAGSEVGPADLLRAISRRDAPAKPSRSNGVANGGLQTVTLVSAPTPRKAPGTPRASRSRGVKR